MSVAGTVAGVDQNLLKLAKEATALLPALRKRFATERGKPDADAGQLADLRKAIRELERAVGRVRFQPHGEQTEKQPTVNRLQKSGGHKYTRKERGPAGHWIYFYKDEHGEAGVPHIKDLHHLAGEHEKRLKEMKRVQSAPLLSGRGGRIGDNEKEVEAARSHANAVWQGHEVERHDYSNYLSQGKPLPADRRANYAGNEDDVPEPEEPGEGVKVDALGFIKHAGQLKREVGALVDDEGNGLAEHQLGALQGVWDAAHDALGRVQHALDPAGMTAFVGYLRNRADALNTQIGEASVGRKPSLRSQQATYHALAAGVESGKLPAVADLVDLTVVPKSSSPAISAKAPKAKAAKKGDHGASQSDAEQQSMMFSRCQPQIVLRKGHKYISKKKDKHGAWIYEYPEDRTPTPVKSEVATRQEALSAKLGGLKARLAEQRPAAGRTAPPAATPAPVTRPAQQGIGYAEAKRLQRQAKNAPLAAVPGANSSIDQMSAAELTRLDAQLEDYIVAAFELQQKTVATDPELRQASELRGAIIRRQEQLRTAAQTAESGYPPEPKGRIADMDAAGLGDYLGELESYLGTVKHPKLKKQAELVRDAVKDRQIELAEEEEIAARPPKTDAEIRQLAMPPKLPKSAAKMRTLDEVKTALNALKAHESDMYKLDEEDYAHAKNKKAIRATQQQHADLNARYTALELDEREAKYTARPKEEQQLVVMGDKDRKMHVHLNSPKKPILGSYDSHQEAIVQALLLGREHGYKVNPGIAGGGMVGLMHGAKAGQRAAKYAADLKQGAIDEAERRWAAKEAATPAMSPLGDSMARAAVQVASTQLARKQALEAAVAQIPNGTTFTIPKATGVGDLAGQWEVANLSPTLAFMHRVGKDESAKNMRPAGEFVGLAHHLADQLPAFRAAYAPVEKSLGQPRLMLAKGHKYTSRKKSKGGEWIYEYDDSPWRKRVGHYLEGNSIPPELYHGHDTGIGTLAVIRHGQDDYSVTHTVHGMKVGSPLVTNRDARAARDMIRRTVERQFHNHEGDLIGAHRRMVADAVKAGKQVPDEVFKDYPDLKPRAPHQLTLAMSQAARGGSGRFTLAGTADHLGAHRREYHRRKEAGEIQGTRKDWLSHATDGWAGVKQTHMIELLRDYRHLEADVRGLEEGPELDAAKVKLETLRTRLSRLGHKV